MPFSVKDIAQQVLVKQATSRWREAIRSGELTTAESEALKKQMGFDTSRMRRGLEQKWKNIAEHLGYNTFTSDPKTGKPVAINIKNPKGLRRVLQSLSGEETPHVAPLLIREYAQYTPYTFVPPAAVVQKDLQEARGLLGRTTKADAQEYLARIYGHEGAEMSAAGPTFGERARRHDLGRGAWLTHFSPRVQLEDIRDTRMLSPRARAIATKVDRAELEQIVRHVSPHAQTYKAYLPRKQLERVSQIIRKAPVAREAARQEFLKASPTFVLFRKELLRRIARAI